MVFLSSSQTHIHPHPISSTRHESNGLHIRAFNSRARHRAHLRWPSIFCRGGYYYQSTTDVTNNEGDTMVMLDVLAKDVGIRGIFSDWPATVSYYANCINKK